MMKHRMVNRKCDRKYIDDLFGYDTSFLICFAAFFA